MLHNTINMVFSKSVYLIIFRCPTQNLVWQCLGEKVEAKMIQRKTSFSPHYGMASQVALLFIPGFFFPSVLMNDMPFFFANRTSSGYI